jgi:S1-C subfamily serine protease
MNIRTRVTGAVLLCLIVNVSGFGQGDKLKEKSATAIPVDTELTLGAATNDQRGAISSAVFITCPKNGVKGSGFLLSTGVIVTAAHVVCGCDAQELKGLTPLGVPVTFRAAISDKSRDIAALSPTNTLSGGLELGSDVTLTLGQRVETWGFPLIYNGPAPLLSVGYVAGYYEAAEKDACTGVVNATRKIKHIVVNGAFNPGNSGGALLGTDKRVTGVVIWQEIAFSGQVKEAIDGFHHPRAVMGGTFSETLPDGTTRGVSDEEVLARVLEEFYNRVQVDIGEAVSVTELRDFLREHARELGLSADGSRRGEVIRH